jgi:micrococcal nuclease
MIKYSTRIYGIDTPEIRTRDDEEKKKGYEARDFLRSYILDQVVKVELLNFDKYGRLLANVYTDINGTDKNVADMMISQGHAKPYFGGTK